MKEIFEKYNSSIYFNSDKELCPITKISIGIALDYSESLSKDEVEKKPFCFSFPAKQFAAIWLSAGILLKNYSDDFCRTVDEHFQALNLMEGDKVEIFNTIAQIESFHKGLPVIKFNDQSGFTLKKKILQYINKVDPKRKLSNFSLYKKKRNLQKNQIDAISKILGAETLINTSLLTSKIILITGRNSSGDIREFLKSQTIYGETLAKILNANKNLEIKASLNSYVDLNNQEQRKGFLDFKKSLEIAVEYADNEGLIQMLVALKDLIGDDGGVNEGFDDLFKELVIKYKSESEDVEELDNLYPGVPKTEVDFQNIKAVVINDIKQLQEFPNIVDQFLKNNVPVFVITDRYPDRQQLEFFKTYFDGNNLHRINWNKAKINGLVGDDKTTTDFLDNDFWEICVKFAKQKIIIEVTEGNRIDKLMPEIRKKLTKYPEYERLRKAYYDNMESAFCSLKNSAKAGENTLELLNFFVLVFNDVKTFIDTELKSLIEELVNEIHSHVESDAINSKSIDLDNDNVFRQVFRINNKEFSIPEVIQDRKDNNFLKTKEISFPGFPYDEPPKHFLNDAVCNSFIPIVTIKCWPREASLTKGYLYKRICAGYFTDNLPEGIEFPDQYLLNSQAQIDKEIWDCFIINQINEKGEEIKIDGQESDLLDLKRGKYQSSAENGNVVKTNPVDCCVVLFEDDCYLFLPVNNHSKLLVGWQDDEQDRFVVKRLNSNQIDIGQLFFNYNFYVDLPTILKLNGFSFEEANKKTVELYEWRNVLSRLYEKSNNDINELTKLFIQTKQNNNDRLGESSPNTHNIKRWLTDDEILSPHLENLNLIFTAAGKSDFDKTKEIFRLRNEIRGMITSLSAAVKKDIEEKYSRKKEFTERSFEYTKQSVNISCQIHKITGIEWDLINVEYSKTRKVICD